MGYSAPCALGAFPGASLHVVVEVAGKYEVKPLGADTSLLALVCCRVIANRREEKKLAIDHVFFSVNANVFPDIQGLMTTSRCCTMIRVSRSRDVPSRKQMWKWGFSPNTRRLEWTYSPINEG